MKRLIWLTLIFAGIVGCIQSDDVMVYTALDSEFSQPVFDKYTQETGRGVRPKFDTEATKTVGLTEAIIAEGDSPRCDVFWNNEILNTLRLEKRGLLKVYLSPAGVDYPAMYRSPTGHWHGFAARARVLIVNNDLVAEKDRPTSIRDLADPKWKDQVGLAKPLFGTTATHAACLFSVWGEDEAKDFFQKLKANVYIESGNKQVAIKVAKGQLAFGLTDTDDAMIEINRGAPVSIIYPDQMEDGLGTLFIPNTLSIIRGCKHPQRAEHLVDYLLSTEVEAMLARGESAQIPLNPKTEVEAQVETPQTIRAMEVDFRDAAAHWNEAATFLRDLFTVD